MLAALKLAHDRDGKLPWTDLFEPAISLARDGFSISPRLAKLLSEADPASFNPEARALFFDDQGRPLPTGYRLKNPALATTLELIARNGIAAFYEGEIPHEIATAVQADPRGAGKLAVSTVGSGRGFAVLMRCETKPEIRRYCALWPSTLLSRLFGDSPHTHLSGCPDAALQLLWYPRFEAIRSLG